MPVFERDEQLELLQFHLNSVKGGNGHCVLIDGEHGIGKTSLVEAFCELNRQEYKIYSGLCDALYTPRLLSPLYDIMWQAGATDHFSHNMPTHSVLFSACLDEIRKKQGQLIIVFEDIHWSDQGTLDFIKYFARRIAQIQCLFIITYSSDEVCAGDPITELFGQIPSNLLSRIQLGPLSEDAINKMAYKTAADSKNFYSISGGNPFYAKELVASGSSSVPENVKASIFAIYNKRDEQTRKLWDAISIIPGGLQQQFMSEYLGFYDPAFQASLDGKFLIVEDSTIRFRHEMYRRTIEMQVPPAERMQLHAKFLQVLLGSKKDGRELEQVVYHAQILDARETVEQFAPLAAARASSMGNHGAATEFFCIAIDCYRADDTHKLGILYEACAGECFRGAHVQEAIQYARQGLNMLRHDDVSADTAGVIHLLSLLYWFEGNGVEVARFSQQAVDALRPHTSSQLKIVAYATMAYVKRLAGRATEAHEFAATALAIAQQEKYPGNIAGSLAAIFLSGKDNRLLVGDPFADVQQMVETALISSCDRNDAIDDQTVKTRNAVPADYFSLDADEAGDFVCHEEAIFSIRQSHKLSWKAWTSLDQGNWTSAAAIVECLSKTAKLPVIHKVVSLLVLGTIKMRRGEEGVLDLLLEARLLAMKSMDVRRIVCCVAALLEYEWLTGNTIIGNQETDELSLLLLSSDDEVAKRKFAFWMAKAERGKHTQQSMGAASMWEKERFPFEYALALFEGPDDNKRKAIIMVIDMGATAVYDRLKREMRKSGVKSVPRGMRRITRSNPAFLTARQLDVLDLLKDGLQNKEIASKLFISAKTVDHHISSILFKLDVNSRTKAVNEAVRQQII
jgi:DNA-binding CsgD family transcriptional regulator